MTGSVALLKTYVERHNRGIRNGRFEALVRLFAVDGVLSFRGIPLGPFRGPDEILRTFMETPPDDELVISQLRGDAERATATYAWRLDPHAPEGTLQLRAQRGRIAELRIVRTKRPKPRRRSGGA